MFLLTGIGSAVALKRLNGSNATGSPVVVERIEN